MRYQSTRGDNARVTAAEAIAYGLANDGGLYVPEFFPFISLDEIVSLVSKPYCQRASAVMGLFLEDFSADELNTHTKAAYNTSGFSHSDIAPLHKQDSNTFFLELWHGPTAAFKDMALQVMPRLSAASLKKIGEKREVCILVATSGDTGKAALQGFCDVPDTRIMVFFPNDGVSDVQRLQMTTQRGNNVNVAAVRGNFDDTQTGVKAIFADNALHSALDERGVFLSSANSINWGRLVPQIAYYFSAYCDLIGNGEIEAGDMVNFCVPTGNFGNILAAYYAMKIGLPINKLICASNRNDVLTQFISTGVYDKNRAFHTTISPSMDILVSSNLERLLFELSDKDGGIVASYMSALFDKGSYDVPQSVLEKIRRVFACGFCSEEDTKSTIAAVWREYGYLIDTHTAVAYKTLCDYRAATEDKTPSVIVSTASPFKFCDSVLEALGWSAGSIGGVGGDIGGGICGVGGSNADSSDLNCGGFALIDALSEQTGVAMPAPLSELRELKPRFNKVIDIGEMKSAVVDFLGG